MADREQDRDTSDVVALAEHFLLIENAGLALAALVPEGRVVMANRAMRELLGYRGDAATHLRAPELRDGDGCTAATWEDDAVERAVRLRRCDGSWLDARVSTVVVRGDGGRPEYLLCLVKAR
jgi:PAS domain S-box-containing protein